MKILILCVGKLDRAMFAAAAAEYEKRLSRFCELEVRQIAEGPVPRNDAQIAHCLDVEGEKMLAALKSGDHVAALCVGGRSYSSEGFASYIGAQRDAGRGRLVFVIGSSHGLSSSVLARADDRISVSAMTFPHQLFRVMLEEQIYRAFTILSGQTYHK